MRCPGANPGGLHSPPPLHRKRIKSSHSRTLGHKGVGLVEGSGSVFVALHSTYVRARALNIFQTTVEISVPSFHTWLGCRALAGWENRCPRRSQSNDFDFTDFWGQKNVKVAQKWPFFLTRPWRKKKQTGQDFLGYSQQMVVRCAASAALFIASQLRTFCSLNPGGKYSRSSCADPDCEQQGPDPSAAWQSLHYKKETKKLLAWYVENLFGSSRVRQTKILSYLTPRTTTRRPVNPFSKPNHHPRYNVPVERQTWIDTEKKSLGNGSFQRRPCAHSRKLTSERAERRSRHFSQRNASHILFLTRISVS